MWEICEEKEREEKEEVREEKETDIFWCSLQDFAEKIAAAGEFEELRRWGVVQEVITFFFFFFFLSFSFWFFKFR